MLREGDVSFWREKFGRLTWVVVWCLTGRLDEGHEFSIRKEGEGKGRTGGLHKMRWGYLVNFYK